jgi:hypothetical protein
VYAYESASHLRCRHGEGASAGPERLRGPIIRVMESELNEVLFTIEEKAFDAFTALLDEPLASNAGLERLLAVKPPWDGHPEGTWADK